MKLCVPKDEFDKLRQGVPISEDDAGTWVKKCVVGKITKAMLDKERNDETNALDMMQNSGIIYHMESLLEMQVLCLLLSLSISRARTG